jgi:hypothetical protein
VGETVILEVKSTEQPLPVHEAQLFTYLRLSSCTAGLSLNFNTPLLEGGLRGRVFGYSLGLHRIRQDGRRSIGASPSAKSVPRLDRTTSRTG